MSSEETGSKTPVSKYSRVTALKSTSKVRSAFKSPLRSTENSEKRSASLSAPPFRKKLRRACFVTPQKSTPLKPCKFEVGIDDISSITAEIKQQEQEIELLHKEGIFEEELQSSIEKLHDYNEIKDTAQLVIGRLAVQLQTTTRDLYPRFELNFED